MALTHLGNQKYQGLEADTKPVVADTAVGAMYEAIDTGNLYKNDGAAWVLLRSPDQLIPVTWLVYIAGSTYKAKNGLTGKTDFSGANLKTNIWDNIKSTPATRNRIHFMSNANPYDIPSGSTLDIPSAAADYYVTGESMHGVRIRPLGNNIAMSCTNLRRARISDIGFYVDQGASYTTDVMRVIASAGGCSEIEIDHIKMRHDDGATLDQAGRNLVFLLSGADANISWTNCHDCWMMGSDSAIAVTSSSPTGYPWFNENWFTNIHATWTKRFFLSNMPAIGGSITNSAVHRLILRDCAWQTTNVDATSLDFFRVATDVRHRGVVLAGCQMWDPKTTNQKFLNIASTDCRIRVTDCEPISDVFMGGTAWDATNLQWNTGTYVIRESETSRRSGVSTQSGDGTTTTFNIAHGMKDYIEESSTVNVAPKLVFIREGSRDTLGKFWITKSTTNITLNYAIAPPSGTNNLTWSWEAIQYV